MMSEHQATTSDCADSADALVATRALTKHYGARAVVDRVDLVVRPGEVYGIAGPEGAGKSTLLRMLAGLDPPTSGSARVAGRPAADPGAAARVAALIERPVFPPGTSGRAALRSVGRSVGVRPARVDAALESVGLTRRADEAFGAYPPSVQWHLAIAAALLDGPELLLLDEPISGVDPAGLAPLRRLVHALVAWGHTVVIASRRTAETRALCDRVALLSRGRLDTPESIPAPRWPSTGAR